MYTCEIIQHYRKMILVFDNDIINTFFEILSRIWLQNENTKMNIFEIVTFIRGLNVFIGTRDA